MTSSNHGACLLVALVLLALALPTLQLDWQSHGNMTESNMTQIRALIASNPVPSGAQAPEIDNVAQNVSTNLNNLWDPAWNVIIYSLNTNVDAVVYGYAFRGHWLWFNGLPNPNNGGQYMTYIIWKDYNCIEWRFMNSTFTGFTNEEYTVLVGKTAPITVTQINNDPWSAAYNYVLAL